jgi:hypothetical protein
MSQNNINTKAGRVLHKADCWNRYPGQLGKLPCECGLVLLINAIEIEAATAERSRWEKGNEKPAV